MTCTLNNKLFDLLGFNDRDGDGVIAGNKEGYALSADIDQDGKIDEAEAKFFLATLTFPRSVREHYALLPEEVGQIDEKFTKRLSAIEKTSSEKKEQELLSLTQSVLISGNSYFSDWALNILDAVSKTNPDGARDVRRLNNFPDTYEDARKTFLQKISNLITTFDGVEQQSIAVPSQTSPSLSVDVAYIPATKEKKRLLVFISGTHGVEGSFGSAAQAMLLDKIDHGDLSLANTGVLMAHAYNPRGFENELRFMEDGIDPNRNNPLDPSDFQKPSNPLYIKLNRFINPSGPFDADARWRRHFSIKAVFELLTHGHGGPMQREHEAMQAIMEGQSAYPGGLSYAGMASASQLAPVTSFFQEHSEGYQEIVIVDMHTGWGERGAVSWINTDRNLDETDRRRVKELFSDDVVFTVDDKKSYTENGGLTGYLCHKKQENQSCLDVEVEAGTMGTSTSALLLSLRTLIGMSQFGREGAASPQDELEVRQEILNFLNPRDADWRASTLRQMDEKLTGLFN